METMRRFSRRTFVAWVGGAGAGFYLFGRLPGMSAPVALAQIPGGTLDPSSGAEVPDTDAGPAGDAACGHDHAAGRQERRLLRDLDAAVRAADPPGGSARDDGVGVRRERGAEQPWAADPQRSLAHDRGDVEQAGAGQVDQRAGGRERELPAASASGRPDAALGEPARWHRRSGQQADVHGDAWSLHGPGADGHARAWRCRCGR